MSFSEPAKRIFDGSDLPNFRQSVAYERLHASISKILEKVKGIDVPSGVLDASLVSRKNTPDASGRSNAPLFELKQEIPNYTPAVEIVIVALENLNRLIDETPPLVGPKRFGNMACRDFHIKLEAEAGSLLQKLAPVKGLVDELRYYFINSFGSATRLDFGSGHELSFVAFVGGMMEYGIMDEKTPGSDILAMFSKYYDTVRRLILVYNLEPAGSHGVWGLDDHFHFIYILGAAQFNSETGTKYVPPVLQILTPQTINSFQESNLYVNAIAFIFKIKLGPFHEHSPIIYDIHKLVSLWAKVLSGLLKMYEVEVFGKFPVVQHFWFGAGLYPWIDTATMKELPVRTELKEDNEDTLPGLINGFAGTKTTNANIAMTGAPWARHDIKPSSRGTARPRNSLIRGP